MKNPMTKNTIDQHVVSLELAKRLKEVGYPQDTIYCWWVENGSVYLTLKSNHGRETKSEIYAAPLASELGEELPETIKKDEWHFSDLLIRVRKNEYITAYHGSIGESSYSTKMADSLAQMWLYLKKEGLL